MGYTAVIMVCVSLCVSHLLATSQPIAGWLLGLSVSCFVVCFLVGHHHFEHSLATTILLWIHFWAHCLALLEADSCHLCEHNLLQHCQTVISLLISFLPLCSLLCHVWIHLFVLLHPGSWWPTCSLIISTATTQTSALQWMKDLNVSFSFWLFHNWQCRDLINIGIYLNLLNVHSVLQIFLLIN